MADKNITLRQKNTSGVYDKLYTKTTATQSKLSTATAALFGDGTSDADAALAKIADTVKSIGNVQVKVVDPNGNPIQGARVTGLYGTPTTASDGTAHGVLQTNPISISSPYIDLKDQTADASGYVGSFDVLVVTLPVVGENSITRITSSKTVKFSKAVKTVDVCCVGGGGGGSGGYGHGAHGGPYNGWVAASWKGKGGAGGNIVNSYGITITPNTNYTMTIGAGGIGSATLIYDASDYGEQKANPGGQGGSTTFLSVTATGGGGATSTGGVGISTNGGNGGSGKATGTEFDDGITFYSGGGANGGYPVYEQGRPVIISGPVGGSPNGGYGGYTNTSGSSDSYYGVAGGNGLGAGGGGGGGNADTSGSSSSVFNYMTKGGNGASGLVAIRFHF